MRSGLWVDNIFRVKTRRIFAWICFRKYYLHMRMCCSESVDFIALSLVECFPPFNFHAFQVRNWGQLGWSQVFNCKITGTDLDKIRELSNLTNEQLPLFFSELTVDTDDFVPFQMDLDLVWRQWKWEEINFIPNSICNFTESIVINEMIGLVIFIYQIHNVPLDMDSVF